MTRALAFDPTFVCDVGMHRIAVLSDIHGNVPALEAVLEDLERIDPHEVFVAGDLVGRGPEGDAVVSTVRHRGWAAVRGNHEDYLIAFRRRTVDPAWLDSEDWAAARFMADELSTESLAFIEGLPLAASLRLAPGVTVVHGSPRANNDGIGPWTPDEIVRDHLDAAGTRVLVCAHTHKPIIRSLDGRTVINVGSVGLPFNGDRRAQYAVLHVDGDHCEPELRQVPYRIDDTLARFSQTGFFQNGGITAVLLAMELEDARPYLTPFLAWAHAEGLPPRDEALTRFLEHFPRRAAPRNPP
jgi:predicted phosphodiesterase